MIELFTAGRYALVSAVCLLTHNLVLILGSWAGLVMPVAVALSFCTVLLLGFTLHARFTFAVHGDVRAFLRYAAAMAGNVPLTLLLLWGMVDLGGWAMAIAAPVSTLVLVIFNFATSRWAMLRGAPEGAIE